MAAGPQTSQELQVGQVFEGKYKILRELGRGGFGMVYLAFQEGMDRHVALKVLKSSVTASAPSAKERFLREVKIISKLKHPNTVTIHDFGETYDGGLYMVLEYVEGETLKQIVKRDGAQDALRAGDIARQIARSLAEAHRHGVVHRDLKPANIMVTSLEADKDFVKVLDFGVARLLDPKTDDLTSVGLPEGERELIGTPRYMSPEQVRGESLTGASDIYGLGLMLYESLSGEPAVQGDTTMGLITQQISPEPLKLPMLPHFHPAIQDIIRIATSKRLQDRFQTAEQMADALESVIFQIRRERNLTGPGSGDVPMASYQSQLTNMSGTGWNPGGPPQGTGWNQQHPTPSGQWMQSGHHGAMPQNGFDPRQTPGPMQPGYPPGQSAPHMAVPGSGQYQQMPGLVPQSGQYPHVPQSGPYATPPPNQNPYGSGFNEIELPSDDDFKPTIERDALDSSMLGNDGSDLIDRNLLPGSAVSRDMPPLPDNERPFQVDRPESGVQNLPTNASAHDIPLDRSAASVSGRVRPSVPQEETLGEFTLEVVKACLLATTSLIGGYVAFLLMGAALAGVVGGGLRLVLSIAIAVVVPIIAAIAEGSNRERFRVVEPIMGRINKALLSTTVFAVAAAILLSGAFATKVVHELLDEPNWFLSDPDAKGFPNLNRKVSYALSDIVREGSSIIGLYDKKKARKLASPSAGQPGRTKALPAPTRSGSRQVQPSTDDQPKSEIPEPGEGKSGNDYVDW